MNDAREIAALVRQYDSLLWVKTRCLEHGQYDRKIITDVLEQAGSYGISKERRANMQRSVAFFIVSEIETEIKETIKQLNALGVTIDEKADQIKAL